VVGDGLDSGGGLAAGSEEAGDRGAAGGFGLSQLSNKDTTTRLQARLVKVGLFIYAMVARLRSTATAAKGIRALLEVDLRLAAFGHLKVEE